MSPISSIIVFIIILSMVKLARHVQFHARMRILQPFKREVRTRVNLQQMPPLSPPWGRQC